KDCEAAVSPIAYLADLLDYAVDHLKQPPPGTVPIDLQQMTEKFHQPFGDLLASCSESEKQVRQERIWIEVLRNYLAANLLPAAGSKQQTELSSAEKDYRFDAYTTLLTRIGTSYADIRLCRTDEPASRTALANRLDISLTVPRPNPATTV